MPHLVMRRLTVAAGLACVVLTPTDAATAAVDDRTESTYSCLADTITLPVDTAVSFTPSGLPAKVTAGGTLSLRGTLGISLSGAQTLASRLVGAKALNVESSTFRLVVSVDGKESELVADEAVGPPVEIASPTVVTAAVSFPDVAIPADARGDLVVSMPHEATVDRTVAGAPSKVVFGAVLNQDSLFVSERTLDCTSPKDTGEVVVARIPISPAPEPTVEDPTVQPTTDPAPEPDPAPSEPLPADPGAVADLPPVEQPASLEPVVAEAAPQLVPTNAPIPPRSTGNGTFLPTWSLLLTFALVPAGFILYAARQRKRLQQLIHAHRSPEGTSR